MNSLCFALILAQAPTDSPPAHIQDLLKKKVLYQLKQGNPDLMFYFDEPTCTVVGNYNFIPDNLEIYSTDRALDLKIPYSDILQGKTLELSSVATLIEAKANIMAAASTKGSLLEPVRPGDSRFRKWLPWVIGAVGLSVGGIVIYNSLNHGDGGPAQSIRTFR